MANKKQRRELYATINSLTRAEVAAIVKEQFPHAKGERLNELAKAAIAPAHRIASSRK